MIDALVTGKLLKDPEARQTKTGKPMASARLKVHTTDPAASVLCGVVAERLGKRKGQRTDLGTSGNISGGEKGETRDLAAAKAGFGSGKTLEAAQAVIAEGAPELVAAMDKEHAHHGTGYQPLMRDTLQRAVPELLHTAD
jgi:hypothetical protein